MRAWVPVLALAFVLWAHEVGVWAHQPHEQPEDAIRIFSIAVVLQKGEDLVDTSLVFSSSMTPHQAVESFCWRHACSVAHRKQALSVANDLAGRGFSSALPTGLVVTCNASYPVLLHHRSGFSELRMLPLADCDREGEAIDIFCQAGGCSIWAKQRLKEVLVPPPATLDTASSSDPGEASKGSVSTRVPPALQVLFPECAHVFWEWYAPRNAPAVPTPKRLAVVVPARNAAVTLLEALQSINASAAHLAATQTARRAAASSAGHPAVALPVE